MLKSKMIQCKCKGHAIQVSWFPEDKDCDWPEIYLTFFTSYRPYYGLWDKMKLMWKILIHGETEGNDITLTRDDAEILVREINCGLEDCNKKELTPGPQ
jgi:hypothetical protein